MKQLVFRVQRDRCVSFVRIPALGLVLFLGFLMGSLQAQDSGIQGRVTDETGAVIPGAEVSVTHLGTAIRKSVITNDVGYYSVPLLSAGRYKVEAAMPGFTTQETEIRLQIGQVARVDFQMKIGEVTEIVEVRAESSVLQSKPMDVGEVIDEKRILEMPLNGRNYLDLAKLTIGVLPARQLGRGHRAGDEGSFIAVGMHAAQNNVLLDGADNSSQTSGGPLGFEAQAVKPSVDAVSEFKVITNNTSAEHGYRMGAKVIVSTKSGTNEFHGSVYEFHRNDALGANNFFANRVGAEKPKFLRNQFGATFGGPIVKNRTFFFASYQGTRIRKGESFISTVPSEAVRNGDFSNEPPQRRNVYDPLTLTGSGAKAQRQQFPNNRIPSDRFDPVAKTIIDLYPLPNITGREHLPDNYFFSPTTSDDADQYDFRVDHNFNTAHSFFVRYSYRDQFKDEPGPLPFPAMGGLGQTVDLEGHNMAVNYNTVLGTRAHNEFRFGWTWFPTRFDIPFQENLNKKFGIKGAPGDSFGDGLDHGYARFNPSGFRQIGARSFWPNNNNLKTFRVADNLLIQKGNHAIKFGGEYRRTEVFRLASRFRRGLFSFNGVYTAEFPNVGSSRANTGNGMADMLLGWASSTQIGTPSGETPLVAPYFGLFVQDDWRVTSRLTLNLGLRWEFFGAPSYPGAPETNPWVSRFTFTGTWPNIENFEFVLPPGAGKCACKNDLNNFAPRIGLAYRVAEKTVLRLGGGIYYGEADYIGTEVGRYQVNPPNTREFVDNQPRERTSIFVRNGFPPLPPPLPTNVIPNPGQTAVDFVPEFLPTMYAGQWFVDLQHVLPDETILTIGYNGSAASHLSTSRNINNPLEPHPTLRAFDRRRNPLFRSFDWRENTLDSNYNSLTVKAEKRYRQGLTFLSSFTWAHNIDHGNEALNQDLGGSRASEYNISWNRAHSALDRRLAYTLSFLYELPLGRNRAVLQSGPLSWILGGWQVGGILSLLSGTPHDHTFNVDNQNNGGRVRGDLVRDPNLDSSQRSIDRWFDTEFVRASASGVISNAGRNLIIGPGRRNFDFIAAKNFYLPWQEGHYVQFRFEAFNFTNTPHFGSPNTSVGSPAAGRINEAEEGRLIQFGLK